MILRVKWLWGLVFGIESTDWTEVHWTSEEEGEIIDQYAVIVVHLGPLRVLLIPEGSDDPEPDAKA